MNKTNNENNTITDMQKHHAHLEQTQRSSHRLGVTAIALIFGLFGLWSVFAELETTISAEGKVITRSYNKIVMHPHGGIVKKIFIQEGDHVKKDQALLELDNIEYKSQLASNTKKHDRNLFSICKLKTQAVLSDHLDCREYQKKIIDVNSIEKLETDTEMLFLSDMKSLQAKIDLLGSNNNVLLAKNRGLEKQIKSNQKLLVSFQKELKKWNQLVKENAVDELKAIETERQIDKSYLEIGSLQSKIEENLASIKANEKQIELDKESFKNKTLTQGNELELENQLILNMITSLQNNIQNSTIKSPSDGLVTDMKIHATREVVSPQKPIMSIVPNEKDLMIEAYVLPTDIEKIYKGQKTEVSFPAFIDPSAMPIEGELTYISADAITPENSKASFYRVLIKITPKGYKAIEGNNFVLMPGMPSAIFIQTGKKTLLEYLMQPIIQMFKGIYHAN